LKDLAGRWEKTENLPTHGHRPETAVECSESAGRKVSPCSTPAGNLGTPGRDSPGEDGSLFAHPPLAHTDVSHGVLDKKHSFSY